MASKEPASAEAADAPPAKKQKKSPAQKKKSPKPKKAKKPKPEPVIQQVPVARLPPPAGASFKVTPPHPHPLAGLQVAPPPAQAISWNVDGLRAPGRTEMLEKLVADEAPDLICLQETKLQESHVKDWEAKLDGYSSHWSCSTKKKGYAGTSVFLKHAAGGPPPKPNPFTMAKKGGGASADAPKVTFGIGDTSHDGEGRAITVEYPTFFVVALYVPNSGMKLERLDYRLDEWDPALRSYLTSLQATKPVLLTGDLNVAHHDIDIYNYFAPTCGKSRRGTPGCTLEERESCAPR
eukprot:COSAG04_NODE_5646_length_1541_cov_11.002439_2_plen_292_part_01